jgi:eukaryotic-like serine/threonine-protein kinase
MSPDRWQRIRAAFDAAIALPAAEAEEFLRRECGADDDLYDEVRRMLREHAASGPLDHSPYETPRGGPEASLDAGETDPLEPIRAGGDQSLIGVRLKERYLLQRELGRGGFGVVYLALDEQLLSKRVVVKIMLSAAPDPWRRRKFRTEIEALARLSHPGIVSVSDSGATEDGRPFLVMEYVEGVPLRSLIRPEGMDLERVAEIVRQVGRALDAAHRRGIWHRDLKPENIMIQTLEDGEQAIKLIDFGIATVTSSEELADTTSRIAGTIRYMAPEQLTGKPSAASDIYALGAIAYEMVTGRTPFPAENSVQLHTMQKAGVQLSPGSLRPSLPEEAGLSILKALEFEERDRYRSVIAFVQDLVQGIRGAKPPEAVPRSERAKPRSRSIRRSGVKLAAFLGVALVLAAAAFALRAPHFQTSMVVFQINDLANDPAYRPLSAGLTGELVSRLVRVDGLSVKQYYGTREKASLATVTDRFYLDGDLQKYRNRIRLTIRLTDTEKGNAVVWSNSFDHDLDNPLELETEVAQRVVEGLEDRVFSDAPNPVRAQLAGHRIVHSLTGLLGAGQAQVATTNSPAAYQAYMRGRQLFEERTPAAVRSAIESLNQAVNLDPNFALAYAALSDAYRGVIDGRQGPQEEMLGRSLRYAEKAVSLSPQPPEAYAALAGVQQMQWDWEGSERSYREAIRLDPKSPVAYRRYGGLILQFGRFDEALEYVKKGLELDPYDYPGQAFYGFCLRDARRYPEAEEQLKWTLAQRDFISAHNNLGGVYALRGQGASGDEARRYFDLALAEAKAVHDLEVKGSPTPETFPTPVSDSMFALTYAMRGDRIAARRYLELLIARPEISQTSPADLAEIYAALGETSTAVSYLQQAARIKDRGLMYLKVDPRWDPIRQTDGYREVLLTMRL